MGRSISTDLINALNDQVFRPVLLIEFQFKDGIVRTNSTYNTISYDGNDYLGVGTLLSISEVEDSLETKANALTLNLTGVDSAMLAIALDEEQYKGRVCKVYLGGMSNSAKPEIIDAFLFFSGRMDLCTIEDGGTTAVIALSVENRLAGLLRTKESRYTDQDQKRLYSTDRGFEYVAGIQGKDTEWGRTG